MNVNLGTLRAYLLGMSGAAEVKEGWAGGMVALWAVNPDNHLVCLTEQHGLFCPHMTHLGPAVDVDGFAIGVYASEEDYLDGGDLIRPMVLVNADDDDHSALLDALAVACGRE